MFLDQIFFVSVLEELEKMINFYICWKTFACCMILLFSHSKGRDGVMVYV